MQERQTDRRNTVSKKERTRNIIEERQKERQGERKKGRKKEGKNVRTKMNQQYRDK